MRKTLLAVILLGVGIAGYLGYTRLAGSEPALQLVTAPVTRGDLVKTIDATGRLDAVTTVQVGTQVSGTIKALHADFNSRVRRGQIVAELEPSLFETQVEQAQATVVRLQADAERARVQFEDARAKLARTRDLAERQLVPATDLETAEANARAAEAALKAAEAQVVQAKASLNQARVNLSHTIIRAPIDGVVISRNVDVGQTVAASMQAPVLFQIANDLSRMQVTANIDEADIGQVEIGQPVTFQVDAFPGERFSGTVSQVRLDPVIESNVVSYVTVIAVSNPDLRLRPGMTATVTVEVARAADTLKVPAAALRFEPGPEVFAMLGQPAPGRAPAIGSGMPGDGPASTNGTAAENRQAMRERLARMSPEEHAAFFAARGRPADGDGATTSGARTGGERGTPARVWVLAGGQLQPVLVRARISDGAHVAVAGRGLEEGVQVVTGAAQSGQGVAAPASGSPLLPFGGRRPGAGRQGGTARPPQGGGARGGQ